MILPIQTFLYFVKRYDHKCTGDFQSVLYDLDENELKEQERKLLINLPGYDEIAGVTDQLI